MTVSRGGQGKGGGEVGGLGVGVRQGSGTNTTHRAKLDRLVKFEHQWKYHDVGEDLSDICAEVSQFNELV